MTHEKTLGISTWSPRRFLTPLGLHPAVPATVTVVSAVAVTVYVVAPSSPALPSPSLPLVPGRRLCRRPLSAPVVVSPVSAMAPLSSPSLPPSPPTLPSLPSLPSPSLPSPSLPRRPRSSPSTAAVRQLLWCRAPLETSGRRSRETEREREREREREWPAGVPPRGSSKAMQAGLSQKHLSVCRCVE